MTTIYILTRLICTQYKKRLPRELANVMADRKSTDSSVNCEKILMDTLISLRSLLFRYHASTMSHDMGSVMEHVMSRATEATETDLVKIVSRLTKSRGKSVMHKSTAYAQLSRQMLHELEAAVFDVNKRHIDQLREDKLALQDESLRVHQMLGKVLAAKEQELDISISEKQELECQVKALRRSNELIKNELEKTLRDQAQTHQLAVELRMQGLDFKAEVDRRCANVLSSIQTRMGFIPAGIQQTISKLKVLKAPGDPAYDAVRSSGSLKYRNMSPSRSGINTSVVASPSKSMGSKSSPPSKVKVAQGSTVKSSSSGWIKGTDDSFTASRFQMNKSTSNAMLLRNRYEKQPHFGPDDEESTPSNSSADYLIEDYLNMSQFDEGEESRSDSSSQVGKNLYGVDNIRYKGR